MVLSPELLDSPVDAHPRRRVHPRYALRSLAYVKLAQANGGIVRDLTESGIAIQAVVPLSPGEVITLRFDLLSPRVRVEARGRVVWSDRNGQGGIEFLDLPPRMQRALRDWLFLQIFSAAATSGRDSMFADYGQQFTLAAARPAIIVEPLETTPSTVSGARDFRWGWFSLTAHSFSVFIDTLILLCAVLLFSISSVVIMGGLPAWPLAAMLCVTSSIIFAAVYKVLFSDLLCGASPGKRLAMLATHPEINEPSQRFR